MANIKFSHFYKKLEDRSNIVRTPIKTAKLLHIGSAYGRELSDAFVDYDTDFGKYELPIGTLYMILIFQKPNGDLFTTCRRYTNEKHTYYKKLIGQNLDIIINA